DGAASLYLPVEYGNAAVYFACGPRSLGAAAAPGVALGAPTSGAREHQSLDGSLGPDRRQDRILRRVDGQWRKAGRRAAPASAPANAKAGRSIVTADRSAAHARRHGGGLSTRSTSAVSMYSGISRICPSAMPMTKQSVFA